MKSDPEEQEILAAYHTGDMNLTPSKRQRLKPFKKTNTKSLYYELQALEMSSFVTD